MSYALIAGIDDVDPFSCQRTEVMYVDGTTKICQSTANYPEHVHALAGGSFLNNNLIVACGGSRNFDGTVLSSACYSMSNDTKWTNFANLTKPISETASVIVKNGLWMTGNDVINSNELSSPKIIQLQ